MKRTYFKADPDGVARFPDLDCLNHPRVSQLSEDQLLVKLTRSLAIVGLDAANEVRICLLQCLHQSYERGLREGGGR